MNFKTMTVFLCSMLALAAPMVSAYPYYSNQSQNASANSQAYYLTLLEEENTYHQMRMENLRRSLRQAEEYYEYLSSRNSALSSFQYQTVLDLKDMIREEQQRHMEAVADIRRRASGNSYY